MKPCKIEGCDNEVKDEARTGVCHQCQASLYYWARKRPAQVLIRRGKLRKYTNRLGEFFDDKGQKQQAKPQKGGGNKRSARARSERRPPDTTLN